MKMKKISEKQIALYVTFVGFLLLAAVYFLVFNTYMDKSEVIEKSNQALNTRVNELKVYYDNMTFYNEEMVRMEEEMNTWLNEFPADVKEEDVIVLALDTEEVATIDYTNINVGERKSLKTIPIETVQPAGIEELQQELVFVERQVSYINKVDYTNLKECITAINNMPERMVISNITYARDTENNSLEGTIEVTFYSVIGTNKEYIPQNLPNYESGLANLFKIG